LQEFLLQQLPLAAFEGRQAHLKGSDINGRVSWCHGEGVDYRHSCVAVVAGHYERIGEIGEDAGFPRVGVWDETTGSPAYCTGLSPILP
jgi:hypothetical protein